MAGEQTDSDEVRVEIPAPGTLVRHRRASLEVGSVPRGPATVEVREGAAWLRATPDGPGLVLTHGASTVQLQDGAAVVEVHEFEALVVVIAGRVAVKGTAALPRSVPAGHAVSITLDGTSADPEAVAAGELAGDRMVVENLALDVLGADRQAAPRSTGAAPGADHVHRGAVDGPPPAAPTVEPSPLESALVGVGVVDDPRAEEPGVGGAADGAQGSSEVATADTTAPVDDGSASRRRLFLVLVVAALIVVAVVAALAFSAGGAPVTVR